MHQTTRLIRTYRLLRLSLHLLLGLLQVSLLYPWLGLNSRAKRIQHWSQQLLSILQIKVIVQGSLPGLYPSNTVLVANHVSWVDIFIINSVTVSRFIAKAEIRRWPLIGWLCHQAGTLFIEREKRRDTARVNNEIANALREGHCIAIFPEGSTSLGFSTKPFNGALLQPAVEAEARIQPIALRYYDYSGERSHATAYVDDMSLLQSLRNILRHRQLIAEVQFIPPLSSNGKHRRELNRQAEALISACVKHSANPPATPCAPACVLTAPLLANTADQTSVSP